MVSIALLARRQQFQLMPTFAIDEIAEMFAVVVAAALFVQIYDQYNQRDKIQTTQVLHVHLLHCNHYNHFTTL